MNSIKWEKAEKRCGKKKREIKRKLNLIKTRTRRGDKPKHEHWKYKNKGM